MEGRNRAILRDTEAFMSWEAIAFWAIFAIGMVVTMASEELENKVHWLPYRLKKLFRRD
jgi:hypothetical protein